MNTIIKSSRNLAAIGLMLCNLQGAHAQDVKVYGILDASLSLLNNGGANRTTRVNSGDLQTSRLGFDAVEDLGGGNKAKMSLLAGVGVDTGTLGSAAGGFNLGTSVGLEGNWGSADLGYLRNPMIFVAFATDLSGYGIANYGPTSILHHQNVMIDGVGGFYANSARYRTPNLGGFKAELAWSNGSEVDPFPRDKAFTGMNVMYQKDQLFLGGGYTRFSTRTAAASFDTRASIAGGYYDFGSIKIGGDVIRSVSPGLNQTGVLANAKWRVTSVSDIDFAVATLSETGGKSSRTVSAGYNYHLSKRTDLYAYALALSNNSKGTRGLWYFGTATVAAGAGSSVVGAGIRHAF